MKMYNYTRQSILLFTTVLLLHITTFAQGFSPQTQARLQHVLDSFQNNPANPVVGGLSAAIKVDGLAFWQGATGYAARNIDANSNLLPGGTPFTTHTLSRMYSITKTFTAPLVLELVQEGVFSLEDPISKYMPYINAYNQHGISTSVTIRQLLNHTSGYSDWEEERDLQIAIAFDPTHKWTPYELVAFTHQLDAPGAVSRYSHNNYVFLGAIIEAATGKQVEDLYRERFFNPLHLTSMYMDGREPIGSRGVLAAPHDNISPFNPIFQFTGQPTFPDAYTNISRFPMDGIISLAFTGGALVSNAADIAEWGNALFGGRATSKAVLDQMLQSISPVPDEFGNRLGYGIKLYDKISATDVFLGHNGSAPGYRSVMVYNPERKMTIAFLSNYGGIDPYAVARALFEALPDFLCGNDNRSEAKIQLCWNGKDHCIARTAADGFIKRGAYLGACDEQDKKGKGAGKDKHISSTKSVEHALETVSPTNLMVYPNPASGQVRFTFKSAQTGQATLQLYDVNGKQVAKLFNRNVEKGFQQQVTFNTRNLPAGLYFSRLQVGSTISQQKLVVHR
jgi:CubicO group peptidase (beta-lactamase class C family)